MSKDGDFTTHWTTCASVCSPSPRKKKKKKRFSWCSYETFCVSTWAYFLCSCCSLPSTPLLSFLLLSIFLFLMHIWTFSGLIFLTYFHCLWIIIKLLFYFDKFLEKHTVKLIPPWCHHLHHIFTIMKQRNSEEWEHSVKKWWFSSSTVMTKIFTQNCKITHSPGMLLGSPLCVVSAFYSIHLRGRNICAEKWNLLPSEWVLSSWIYYI